MKFKPKGKHLRCLFKINTGEEKQKSGIIPSEADQFISDCISLDLPIKGLMVIPPIMKNLHYILGYCEKLLTETVLQAYQWE